jgi:hypothetical protein
MKWAEKETGSRIRGTEALIIRAEMEKGMVQSGVLMVVVIVRLALMDWGNFKLAITRLK